jgi:hypothetical protein
MLIKHGDVKIVKVYTEEEKKELEKDDLEEKKDKTKK